jgi:hypothetical protein
MRARIRSAILGAGLTALASASLALAAQPLKGRTYAGLTAHGKAAVVLSVSGSGKQVTVTVPSLPLYCSGGGGAVQAITKPATVHANGGFGGTILYRFRGRTAYKATFSGRFVSARLIRGSLRSEFSSKSCSGTTTFTAKPAKGG